MAARMGWGLAPVLTGSLPRCRLEEIDIGRLSVSGVQRGGVGRGPRVPR